MVISFLSILALTLVYRPMSLLSSDIDVALLFLVMIVLGVSFGGWLIILAARRVRLVVYDDGFIPQRTPFKMWLKKESWFIPWSKVLRMEFLGPESLLGGGWVYRFVVEGGKGVTIDSRRFEDGGVVVLKKLKEIEEELKKRGLQEIVKGPLIWDG